YIKGLFRELGEVEFSEHHSNHGTEISYPVIVGKFMERCGVPVGDKSLQKFGLPQSIINGSKEIKFAYLEELIPEDGNFHADEKGQAKFQWSRASVLYAGSKRGTYDIKYDVPNELREFLSIHGKKTAIRIDGEEKSQYTSLRYSKLEKLSKSDNAQEKNSATRFIKIIKNNPNQLLLDEVAMCKTLGINIRSGPRNINLYRSGRVSVQWEAITRGQKDAETWAKIAPPADIRKYELVKRWIKSTP
ncbi:MAG: hypothetical protein ACFE89_08350, partial [Candidatus Hodarchaeota archaeon]